MKVSVAAPATAPNASPALLNFRALMHKSRSDLAHMVLDFSDRLAQLRKELELERNTNVHLKAAIRDRV